MKKLSELIDENLNLSHIVILIDSEDRTELNLITEGRWEPSGTKDYWKRLDTPKFDHEQLHVHIAKQKHINSKSQQVSWNKDGTIHDKKLFNKNFNGIETAKRIAKQALGLSDDFVLKEINESGKGELILESIEYLPSNAELYFFILTKKSRRQLLFS